MNKKYQQLRQKLSPQLKKCRDREVRVKASLILLGFKLNNVNEACERRGFSRQFYYKWWKRLRKSKFNLRALEEQSRRPQNSPNKVSNLTEARIRAIHKKGYGARMLEVLLERENIKAAKSTICHVLNHRRKPIKKERKLLKAHHRRYELDIPGQRIQLDVKYVPEFVNGCRVYNYVAVDECTRWRFVRGYYDLSGCSTVDFLDRLIKSMPFPISTIQTDNGFEFTNKFKNTTRSHEMDRWCQKQGIRHKLIPPGEKEINGKVERSHRIDEQYFYWHAPTDTLGHFQTAQNQWLNRYHRTRPHGGLDYQTPFEKLQERSQALSNMCFLDPKLEKVRLRFLKREPKETWNQQTKTAMRLIDSLELAIKKLNHAA